VRKFVQVPDNTLEQDVLFGRNAITASGNLLQYPKKMFPQLWCQFRSVGQKSPECKLVRFFHSGVGGMFELESKKSYGVMFFIFQDCLELFFLFFLS
jgi:hypothetical protein